SLRNKEFKDEIYSLITNKFLDPKRIVFEIYEKEIYDEIPRLNEIITQFKEYGFEIAINQFFGNNASFEYFKYIDFDYVIYDLEVNKNFARGNKIRDMFDIINNSSSKFKTKTIIRFVDKAKLYNELLKTDIDYIQGFYIDKPTKIEI
ncbi:MAG: EAL domain-containing protein, partial [Campylobacter sp.]|nr:EAL domain-containing protein [Campylobacter sp.]